MCESLGHREWSAIYGKNQSDSNCYSYTIAVNFISRILKRKFSVEAKIICQKLCSFLYRLENILWNGCNTIHVKRMSSTQNYHDINCKLRLLKI